MKLKIYTLYHPTTGDVRYVGRTFGSLKNRLKDHITGAFRVKHQDRASRVWIRSLLETGIKPAIALVEEIDSDQDGFEDREKYWIQWYKDQGYELTNVSSGEKVCWAMYDEKHKSFLLTIVGLINSGKSYSQIEKELNLYKGYIKQLKSNKMASANYLGITIPDSAQIPKRGTGKGWTLQNGKYLAQPYDSQKNLCPKTFDTQQEAEEYYNRISNDPTYIKTTYKFKPQKVNKVQRTVVGTRVKVTQIGTGISEVYDSISQACQILDLRRKSVDECFAGRINSHRGYTFEKLETVVTKESRPIVAITDTGDTEKFDDPYIAAKALNLRSDVILKCLEGTQDIHKGYRFSFV